MGSNRWMIAAAAVLAHLCLGSVYAWSVFIVPLQLQTGWDTPAITWAFSTAIAVLGLTAAFGAGFMQRLGPRRSVLLAGVLFGIGLAGAGAACAMQSLTMLYLLFGVVGGAGLGLGYAPPVAALLQWFPDRRGLATGMAVCGFGGGALLASQLAEYLLPLMGCAGAFWILAGIYTPLILIAGMILRLPTASASPVQAELEVPSIRRAEALAMPQFWLLWVIFFINISAGIMLIALAKPMASDVAGLSALQAAWVVPLMGLCNGAGRLAWSAASDHTGRGRTLLFMLLLQAGLFVVMAESPALFVVALLIIVSCYGGGFALTPAYIADLFGARAAAPIYGAALTAWSAAAVCSPPMAAYLHELTGGYRAPLYAAACLLGVGALLAWSLSQRAALGCGMMGPVKMVYPQRPL